MGILSPFSVEADKKKKERLEQARRQSKVYVANDDDGDQDLVQQGHQDPSAMLV
jgi:hypothetical protein